MATLEQVLGDARKLTAEEQRSLREALEGIATIGNSQLSHQTHQDERAWVEAHLKEYQDEWVALDGGNLVAHGSNARAVYDEARAKGMTVPYLVHLVEKIGPYVGGW